MGTDCTGVGETKSLGIELGTNERPSLGTVEGTTDRSSLGIADGTNDEVGTIVPLGIVDSASMSKADGEGAMEINGDIALRSLILPDVELLLRLSDMAKDIPTTAPTSSMAKTINPMGSRSIMLVQWFMPMSNL